MKILSFILLAILLGCGKVAKKSSTVKQDPSALFKAETLKVIVYYEPGAEPYISDPSPVLFLSLQYWNLLQKNLEALFQGRTHVPTVIIPKTLPEMSALTNSNKSTWSLEDVQKLTKDNQTSSSASSFHIYFLNGHASEGANIIGFHITGTTTIAIFKDVIRQSGQNETAEAVPKFVEQATLIHEMGHALGLVNNGVAMQEPHQDKDHGAHCSNPDCVMYYSNEGTSGLINFVKNTIQNQSTVMFDDKCLKDTRSY